MKVGITTALEDGAHEAIRKVHDLGLTACQVTCVHEEPLTQENARALAAAAAEYSIEIATVSVHIPVRQVWLDFYQGPATIGLTPLANREAGMRMFKRTSDFARWAAVPSIKIHLGFTPENPTDPLYVGLIKALQDLAAYCAHNGNELWLECGQETPVTLLRTIQDTGANNVGVNLDAANLFIYGKANAVDSLDTFGRYVRGVHLKDGEYPTDGHRPGVERPIGQGKVNYPLFIARLHELGFDGVLCIERPIQPETIDEIKQAASYLAGILATLE